MDYLYIYHLTRGESAGWDEFEAMGVIAATEEDARALAAILAEGYEWENAPVTCKKIGTAITDKPGVFISDFNAG